MNDLFRLLLLRPAQPAEPKDVKTLAPSFAERGRAGGGEGIGAGACGQQGRGGVA
jgi:hypothetical protein